MAARINHATSAIDQNAGRLSNIDEWSPSDRQRRWLLLSGAINPPARVKVSTRRNRDGRNLEDPTNFIHNVNYDLANMQDSLRSNNAMVWTCRNNPNVSREEAENLVEEFFKQCRRYNWKPMLYYTGHGEVGTGNWCFSNGTIGILEILDWVPRGYAKPTICSDACYSGAWANFCAEQGIEGFECLSACGNEPAFDYAGRGGELTLYMTGFDLPNGRPRAGPLFGR